MSSLVRNGIIAAIGFTGLMAGCLLGQSPGGLAPSTMPRVGKVDDRFQSYNVEMVEVTGGRFWAPYKKGAAAGSASSATPSNQTVPPQSLSAASEDMFAMRPAIDLYNARLRKLAAALAPAYVRVSGSWANGRSTESRWWPTTPCPPATTLWSIRRLCCRVRITGARCCGES
jgi:heparanase